MLDWLFDPVKDSKPYWLELLTPCITIALAFVGYWWGFKVWKKQKQEELRIAAGQQREAARIAACKAVWGLLAYMSEKENERTVFIKRGTKEAPTWHLRAQQGQAYIQQVAEVFFAQGHGIFMSPEVRNDVYEFRSRIYTLMEADKHQHGELLEEKMITVNNPHVIEKVVELRERLRVQLKTLLGE